MKLIVTFVYGVKKMGCLKNIFSLVILILAVIGFVSIGGIDFVMNGLNGLIK